MKAPTPCLEKDCREYATNQGRCATHQKNRWAGYTRKQRLPPDWNTRRLIVLRRDHGICHLCGEPGADAVDHLQAGDDHSLDNLKPIHHNTPPYCHRYKTSQEGHKARADNTIKKRR